MPPGNWKHDELAHDLANHLRQNPARMVWENMQLGPSGSERPDVYTLNKSYSSPRPCAYEVKISVADFRSDITSGKWQTYYQEAGAVIFAVPQGLVSKEDIPKGCGLMIRTDNGWHTAKGPTMQSCKLSTGCLLKLLIDGLPRLQQTIGPREHRAWVLANKLRFSVGEKVASFLQDQQACAKELRNLRDQIIAAQTELNTIHTQRDTLKAEWKEQALKELRSDAAYLRDDIVVIRELCAIPPDQTFWQARKLIKSRMAMADEDKRVEAVKRSLSESISAQQKALADLGGAP